MLRLVLAVAVVGAGGLFLLAGDGEERRGGGERRDGGVRRDGGERRGGRDGRERPEELRPARCPAGVPGCRSVTGPIVFVERVDPDGDGDLHVVIADGSISLPGVTAVDVKPSLRPRRDPRVGDRATAAGPVQTGSYGQRQIHALRFRVQR